MIGQDADRDGFKRAALLNDTITLPEAFDLLEQKVAPPFGKNNREEEKAAFDFGSTILRHDELYHEASWWARREERLCPPYQLLSPKASNLRRLADAGGLRRCALHAGGHFTRHRALLFHRRRGGGDKLGYVLNRVLDGVEGANNVG